MAEGLKRTSQHFEHPSQDLSHAGKEEKSGLSAGGGLPKNSGRIRRLFGGDGRIGFQDFKKRIMDRTLRSWGNGMSECELVEGEREEEKQSN